MSTLFNQYLNFSPIHPNQITSKSTSKHLPVLIECPHSISSIEQRNQFCARISFALDQGLVPILLAQGQVELLKHYAPYIWSLNDRNISILPKHKDRYPLHSELIKIQEGLIHSNNSLIGLFTSGSTGVPKLIWHTLANYYESAKRSAHLLNITSQTKVLSALPCYHNGGFLNLVREDLFKHKLNICSHKDLINQWSIYDPNIIIGVPTQLHQALESNVIKSKQVFYCGGAALDPRLYKRALEYGLDVIATYGLTESCGALVYKRAPKESYSVMENIVLSSTCDNRLQFNSPSNALAYQDKTELHFYPEEISTFDKVNIDSTGGVHILGRTDQMILSSGENIDPNEILKSIEVFLEKNRLSPQVQIVALPDKVKGEIPLALISSFDQWPQQRIEALSQHLRATLSPLKRPRYILKLFLPKKGIKLTRQDIEEVFYCLDTKKWKI